MWVIYSLSRKSECSRSRAKTSPGTHELGAWNSPQTFLLHIQADLGNLDPCTVRVLWSRLCAKLDAPSAHQNDAQARSSSSSSSSNDIGPGTAAHAGAPRRLYSLQNGVLIRMALIASAGISSAMQKAAILYSIPHRPLTNAPVNAAGGALLLS